MILATLMGIPIFMSPEVMAEAGRDTSEMPSISELASEVGEELGTPGEGGPGVGSLIEVEVKGETAMENEAVAGETDETTELELLKAQLGRLVAEEAYEEAALIRDQIIELESDGPDMTEV